MAKAKQSKKISLFGPDNKTKILEMNGQHLLNMYLVPGSNEDKYTEAIYPTPGLTSWSTDRASDTAVRALHENNGTLYAIIDSGFYTFDTNGTATSIGTLSTSTGYAGIASTNTEVCIVDGTSGYIHTIGSGTTAVITSGGFPANPETVTAQDGYFIVSIASSDSFYISNVNDGTTWSALDFETADIVSDDLVAVYSFRQVLHMFGSRSMEPYINTSDGISAAFPFTRQPDGIIEIGLSAKATIANSSASLFWLGRDKNGQNMVLKQTGVNVEQISTPAISYRISQMSTTSDAYAYIYRQEENDFYVLTFPTEKKTFVYNNTTGVWHQWSSRLDNEDSYHRSAAHAFVYGKNIIADTESGTLYTLDVDNYQENGSQYIVREIISAPIHVENNKLSIYKLRLDLQAGQALASGQGSDPQIMLSVSRDGGHTFSNELWRSAGLRGHYDTKVEWSRLGTSKDFVFKFRMTDPVKWAIMAVTAQYEVIYD